MKTMTLEEMKEKINIIERESVIKIKAIQREFAILNNPYKIGDIIEDHQCKIQINDIKYAVFYGVPSSVYYGTLIQKNGKPFKSNKQGCIYQTNIKKEIADDHNPKK
jgi:hypothetical protein